MSNPDQNLPRYHPPYEAAEDSVDLRDYLATLWENRWLIMTVAAAVLVFGIFYAWKATPIYQADAVVQVEEKSSSSMEMDELATLLGNEVQAPAEMEIIKTRSVLGDAVEELNLDLAAKPLYFPVVGEAIARRLGAVDLTDAGLLVDIKAWLKKIAPSYAWGGEALILNRFSVPESLLGATFTLVALESGAYRLLDEDEHVVLEGTVGEIAHAPAGPYAGIELGVAALNARPQTRFSVTRVHMVHAIGDLQQRLKVAEQGRQTGVLQLTLEGTDPNQVAQTVNAVANSYLRQHVERRSEEASKMLEFLSAQLPDLKTQVDTTERALQEHRTKTGSVDLTLEAEQVLNAITEVETRMSELKLQKPELERKFTPSHPMRQTLEQQLAQLQGLRTTLEKQLKGLPGTEWKTLQLERDTRVANELYVLLLNKAQELKVAKAGTVGNVRILDHAFVPIQPIKPKKSQVIAISLVLGMLAGIGLAFLHKNLTKAVDDPDEVEQRLGLPVFASIPHSSVQGKYDKRREKSIPLLAVAATKDVAVEALKSLRTSLQFAATGAANNMICITGPSPEIGKSFVCANLSVVLAEAGKRTLLIDADLRKGHLHRYFDSKRTQGLSGVISGEIDLQDAIRETPVNNLYFLPSGIVPPNPSELLASEQFDALLRELAARYDLLVVDTPPVLAVTDAVIVARHVGATFVLLRAGHHPIKEIERTVKRLNQNGIAPSGFIFNNVPPRSSVYGYGKYAKYGYHYQYEYK